MKKMLIDGKGVNDTFKKNKKIIKNNRLNINGVNMCILYNKLKISFLI